MKKIFALLLIATLTFSSSFATTGLSTTITEDDILQTEMFYIDGQGYIKRDNKLVKVEGIKFYSIAGQRYIKKDGKIEKVSENKIYKVNGMNYVKQNGKLLTLESYLATHNVGETHKKGTFSEMYSAQINKNIDLKLLNKAKINALKTKTLENVSEMISNYYPETTGTLQLINSSKADKELYENLKNYYFEKGDNEISKQFFILENIEKIDIDKVNMAIRAELNNESIKYTKIEDIDYTENAYEDESIEDIFSDILEIDTEEINNEVGTTNEDESDEELDMSFLDELVNEEDLMEFNSAEEIPTETEQETITEESEDISDESEDISDEDLEDFLKSFGL